MPYLNYSVSSMALKYLTRPRGQNPALEQNSVLVSLSLVSGTQITFNVMVMG